MRIRTADPLLAKQVLYQLSYTPKVRFVRPLPGSFKIISSIAGFVKRFKTISALNYKNFFAASSKSELTVVCLFKSA